MKKVLCMLLVMMLCAGCACAEGYVSVADLRQQVEEMRWDKCEVILPAVDAVPVFTVQADALAQDNPLVLTGGPFDEAQSGTFVNSVRYGNTPSHTALVNGLTLKEAQFILNDELTQLVGKSIDDYGLIWTEIAEWKNMETWLLYYGQKFFGLTSFCAQYLPDDGCSNSVLSSPDHSSLRSKGNRLRGCPAGSLVGNRRSC